MPSIQKITPCLWFDDQAEEAAEFYASIFKNSRIGDVTRYGEAGHEVHGKPPGSVMTVAFELDGQAFTALNGGPLFKFNEADLVPGQLRDAGGDRLLLGQALGGRRPEGPAVRLAQGPVRPVVAGRARPSSPR